MLADPLAERHFGDSRIFNGDKTVLSAENALHPCGKEKKFSGPSTRRARLAQDDTLS
jgi:hypothetical protein